MCAERPRAAPHVAHEVLVAAGLELDARGVPAEGVREREVELVLDERGGLLDVVEAAAVRGDLEAVVELSIECVMCGLCAARCPAEISPYNIALFVRRLYGTHLLPKSPQLEQRLKEIDDGKYKAEITQLKATDVKKLQETFNELQANKGASV